jgi:hypothetical protein
MGNFFTSSATINFVDFRFHREADENCVLLGYYTMSSGNNPEGAQLLVLISEKED